MSILGQIVSAHFESSCRAALRSLMTLTGSGYDLQTQQKFMCGFWQSRSHAAPGLGDTSSPAVHVTRVLVLAKCLAAVNNNNYVLL